MRSVSKRFYEIAGRLLSVETDAEWAGRFAEAFIRGLHLTPRAGLAAPAPDIGLRIVTAPAPPLPPGFSEFEIPGGICYAGRDEYHLDVAGSRVAVAARDERRVTVWFGETVRARKTGSLITVLAYALPAALRRCGLYDLHAAGLVEPSAGVGFIFPGMSESGKTSLAVRLAASGWRYMTDDLLVVSEGAGGVEMRGLRRHFQTSAATLAGCRLPRLEEALGVTIPNDPDKRRLEPEVLFPGMFAPVAVAGVLCFPFVATGARVSRLEPAGKAEAMTRLVKMCPWSSYDVSAAREHLRVLARLTAQCKTFTLHAGRDIFDDPSGAARLLAPHAQN